MNQKDIEFLAEIGRRIAAYREKSDASELDMVQEMVRDWLEEVQSSPAPVVGGVPELHAGIMEELWIEEGPRFAAHPREAFEKGVKATNAWFLRNLPDASHLSSIKLGEVVVNEAEWNAMHNCASLVGRIRWLLPPTEAEVIADCHKAWMIWREISRESFRFHPVQKREVERSMFLEEFFRLEDMDLLMGTDGYPIGSEVRKRRDRMEELRRLLRAQATPHACTRETCDEIDHPHDDVIVKLRCRVCGKESEHEVPE